MPENDRRPHIVLPETGATERFRPTRRRISEAALAPRNRRQHGRHLLAELRATEAAAQQTIQEQRAFGVDVGNGIYVEFEAPTGFELPTERLESSRQKIELVAIAERDHKVHATVFVPEGGLVRFERLIEEYNDPRLDTSKQRPKNERLLAQVEHIRSAALEALWTDDPRLIPAPGQSIWWEAWLRVAEDRQAIFEFFRTHGTRLGLQVGERYINFPERIVVAARGTREQMSQSMMLLNVIAELRRPKDTAEFFIDLHPNEQAAWVQELLGRCQFPAGNVPYVCLLDTGVTHQHPLITPVLDAADLHTNNPAWGIADQFGHGTQMAGLSVYGDLVDALADQLPVVVRHRLESVKLLRAPGANTGEQYGDLTREAVARAEIAAPQRRRVLCMAVSSKDDRDRGRPSSWSAAIDALTSGAEDETRRLMIVAAGNVEPRTQWADYPARNTLEGIHDPGQAWNALTVGAFTKKVSIDQAAFPGWTVIAPDGDLAPMSTTSQTWESSGPVRQSWPLKPDVVYEGGNGGRGPAGEIDALASLSLLTTHHQHLARSFDLFGDTSAATALGAQLAAQIQAAYPNFWPETIRALIVHSAQWTPAMLARYASNRTKREYRTLIRHCGFGVPSKERALWSAGNALTLIVQDELQPFDEFEELAKEGKRTRVIRSRDMRLHGLPWPLETLQGLGNAQVAMRVTLSYFIEPNPASRGWTRRYRYESHGLRFDVKRSLETVDQFRRRINLYAQQEEQGIPVDGDDPNWTVGQRARHLGSLHSDTWSGTAAELADRGYIAVFPSLGWWRERKHLERWRKTARYALIISIEAAQTEVDLYAAVMAKIAVPVVIQSS
jgi:hypothetical protein